MKRILLATVFSLLCIQANAVTSLSDKEIDANCRELMGLAEAIMSFRQSGMSLKRALEINDETNSSLDDEGKYEITYGLVTHAYKENYYHTQEYKDSAINEFATSYYNACVDNYRTR